jgi:hypothetical protein
MFWPSPKISKFAIAEISTSGLILLVYFQTSFIETCAFLGFISLLIWSGTRLLNLSWRETLTIQQMLSVGLTSGLALLLFIDYLVGLLHISHWYSLIVLAIIGMVLATLSQKVLAELPTISPIKRYANFLFVIASALLAFNFRALWAMPLSVALIFLGKFIDDNETKNFYFGLRNKIYILIVAFCTAISLGLNTNNWTLAISNDAGFYESLSWSIIRFGPHDHPGFAEGFLLNSLPSYHTAAYSFSGLTSFVSQLDPYTFINRLGPMMLAVILASLFMSLIGGKTQMAYAHMIVSFALTISIIQIGNYNSQLFGLVCLVVFMAIVLKLNVNTSSKVNHLYRYVPVLLTGLLTLFSKGTMLISILAVIFSSFLIQLLISTQKHHWKFVYISNAFVVLLVLFAFWWKFFRLESNVGVGPDVNPGLLSAVIDSGIQQTMLTSRFRLFSLISASAVFGFSLLLRTYATLYLSTFVKLTNSFLFFSLLAFFVFVSADARVDEYLVITHIGIMTVLYTLVSYSIWRENSIEARVFHRIYAASLLVITLALVFVFRVFLIPQSVELWEYLTNVSPKLKLLYYLLTEHLSLGIFISLLAVSTITWLYMVSQRDMFHVRYRVFLLVPLLSALSPQIDNFLDFFINSRDRILVSPTTMEGNSSANPTVDLVSLGNYVRENTAIDSVIASNNFCCNGISWWTDYLENPTYFGENAVGGANYLLPASLQRRFLIQGARFQIGCCIQSFPEHIDRINLSLMFANEPSISSLLALRQYGVDYFVINKRLSAQLNWANYATPVFENNEFLLLKL